MSMSICLHVCKYTSCMQCLWRSEEGIACPETEVTVTAAVWMLGTKLTPSVRAASVLDH